MTTGNNTHPEGEYYVSLAGEKVIGVFIAYSKEDLFERLERVSCIPENHKIFELKDGGYYEPI